MPGTKRFPQTDSQGTRNSTSTLRPVSVSRRCDPTSRAAPIFARLYAARTSHVPPSLPLRPRYSLLESYHSTTPLLSHGSLHHIILVLPNRTNLVTCLPPFLILRSTIQFLLVLSFLITLLAPPPIIMHTRMSRTTALDMTMVPLHTVVDKVITPVTLPCLVSPKPPMRCCFHYGGQRVL